MASVFLAEDTVLHRPVAMKMLHQHLLSSDESLRRFRNEANLAATLSHENIVKVFDYGEENDYRFIILEYVDGTTLDSLLDRTSVVPNLALLSLASQILSGLAEAHAKNIWHRDIKPGNILIDHAGCAKVTDFGIAYLVNSESLTLTGAFLGSPDYVSPELAEGKTISQASDIFSLGSLLYECATGIQPFHRDNPHATLRAIIDCHAVAPALLNPKCIQEISDLVESCLAKDPGQRPDARSCLHQVEEIARQIGRTCDKTIVAEFMADPIRHAHGERIELFDLYRTKAYNARKDRDMALCVRALSQAKAFGNLSASDEALISRAQSAALIRKWLSWAAFGAFIVLLGFWAFRTGVEQFRKAGETRRPANPVIAVPSETPHPDSSSGGLPLSPKDTIARIPASAPEIADKPVQRSTPNISARPTGSPATTIAGNQLPGCLIVKTNPPWARLIIDGIEQGETPKRATLTIPAGTHLLTVSKEGFIDARDSVRMSGGDTVYRMIQLNAIH